MSTVAGLIVERLLESGVRTLFGMPGGGSNMDILEAAAEAGLPFVLSHTETAGALMAAAQAEIRGSPGACLATLGPGVASIANGVAHALLDRVPLVVLTDSHPTGGRGIYLHQSLDHHALLGPVTKWRATLTPESADEVLSEAVSNAASPPPGPVQIDCSPDSSRAPAPSFVKRAGERAEGRPADLELPPGVEHLLKQARRPLLLIGLGARKPADVSAIRSWCDRAAIPALMTYKAKGVIPDEHPLFAGVLTNGALEAPVLEAADLLLLVGLDPVELLPRPWKYRQAAVYCGRWALEQRHVPIDAQLVGEIGESLATLQEILPHSTDWSLEWISSEARRQRSAVRIATAGLSPFRAVEAVAAALPENARLTVDAGAHMFPAMALLPAREAHQILISNGLSTMAFALPAAIGAALVDRQRPVVALTGDGGLLMCAAELATAAREKLRVIVVVFNDGWLSLIRIKQEQQGYRTAGTSLADIDWPRLASALGVGAARATNETELERALGEAAAVDGPSLIEARIDPGAYPETIRVIRGQ